MANEQANKARRKLLKSIAAGGGVIVAGKSLPDGWTRPVVDSVMLPAHAQTSPGGGGGTGICIILHVPIFSGEAIASACRVTLYHR